VADEIVVVAVGILHALWLLHALLVSADEIVVVAIRIDLTLWLFLRNTVFGDALLLFWAIWVHAAFGLFHTLVVHTFESVVFTVRVDDALRLANVADHSYVLCCVCGRITLEACIVWMLGIRNHALVTNETIPTCELVLAGAFPVTHVRCAVQAIRSAGGRARLG